MSAVFTLARRRQRNVGARPRAVHGGEGPVLRGERRRGAQAPRTCRRACKAGGRRERRRRGASPPLVTSGRTPPDRTSPGSLPGSSYFRALARALRAVGAPPPWIRRLDPRALPAPPRAV